MPRPRTPGRRFASPALAAGLLSLLGCHGSGKEAALAPLPPAIHVSTAPIQARPMPRGLPVTGSLVSNQQADVAANTSGQVLKTFVERGAFVKQGAPLLQLDARTASLGETEARANLESARSQEQLAKQQCERSQRLMEKGAITQEEFDRTSSQCQTTQRSAEAARARAELAAKTMTDATVRAPFSGMISERFVSVGEYVHPDTRVVNLVELDPLRLQLTIAEADIGQVKEGLDVAFDVAAFPGEVFHGAVKYVGPAVRASTRDLVVEAVVPNAEHRLRPGMFATAHLQLSDQPLPVVPRSALRFDGTVQRLFTVVDGRIQERVVQTGPERDGQVALLEGAKAGEVIALEPTDAVQDGVPVN